MRRNEKVVEQPLSEQEFEHLLDRHGADSSAWPAAAQRPAAALLAASATARANLEDARLLDSALDAALAPVLTPLGLRARIVVRAKHAEARLRWWSAAWRPLGVACAPLLLGFGLGVVFGLDGLEDAAELEARVLLAFSASDFADLELPETAP